jgi:hypothetical protein
LNACGRALDFSDELLKMRVMASVALFDVAGGDDIYVLGLYFADSIGRLI